MKASGTDLKVQVFSGFPLAFLEKLEKKNLNLPPGTLSLSFLQSMIPTLKWFGDLTKKEKTEVKM